MIRAKLNEVLGRPSRAQLERVSSDLRAELRSAGLEVERLGADAAALRGHLDSARDGAAHREDELEEQLADLQAGDASAWAELGFVPAARLERRETAAGLELESMRAELVAVCDERDELRAELVSARRLVHHGAADRVALFEVFRRLGAMPGEPTPGRERDNLPAPRVVLGLQFIERELAVARGNADVLTECKDRLACSKRQITELEIEVDAAQAAARLLEEHGTDLEERLEGCRASNRLEAGLRDKLEAELEQAADPVPMTIQLLWRADLEAIDEALGRIGVPAAPDFLTSADRLVPDTQARPSLAWRLAWLEGLFAVLHTSNPNEADNADT